MLNEKQRRLRALAAIHTRHGNTELADAASRELRSERFEQAARQLVDNWPPLDAETKSRVAALLLHGVGDHLDDLTPTGGGDDAAA